MIGSILRGLTPLGYAAILWLIVAMGMGVQTLRLENTRKALAQAQSQIVNPMTGKKWSDEAVWSAAEAGALRIALERQSLAVEALRTDAEEKIAQSQQSASAAVSRASAAQRAAAEILARKPKGETTCERAVDQQRAFLEKLP